jgi:hypothetical protein
MAVTATIGVWMIASSDQKGSPTTNQGRAGHDFSVSTAPPIVIAA